jgi:hypothetical protein
LQDRTDLKAFRALVCAVAVVSVLVFEWSAAGLEGADRDVHADLATVAAAASAVAPSEVVLPAGGRADSSSSLVSDSSRQAMFQRGAAPGKGASTAAAWNDADLSSSGQESTDAAGSASKKLTTKSKSGAYQPHADEGAAFTYYVFLRQLLSQPNFLIFVAVSTLQVYQRGPWRILSSDFF